MWVERDCDRVKVARLTLKCSESESGFGCAVTLESSGRNGVYLGNTTAATKL